MHELWAPSLEKLGFVPNVLRLYALRPSNLVAWNAWYDVAMKGDSGLTKVEREMIAVVVSLDERLRVLHRCPLGRAAQAGQGPDGLRPARGGVRGRRVSSRARWRCSTTR